MKSIDQNSPSSRLIAITGGIGSGKSVVCRILAAMGYPVYDCDSKAKAIMEHSDTIKHEIAEKITPLAIRADGSLCREAISEVVFHDAEKLRTLNSIVHGAVRADIKEWTEAQTSALAFVETAILYQSKLDTMVDEVWEVTAPMEIRIDRVCRRNGLHPEHVRARIDSQAFNPETVHPHVSIIENDGLHSVLLQVHNLLKA